MQSIPDRLLYNYDNKIQRLRFCLWIFLYPCGINKGCNIVAQQ